MADSKNIDDGGPAFPWAVETPAGSFNPIQNRTVPAGEVDRDFFPGMSLRDHFATHALGMGFDWCNLHETGGYADAAKVAYEIADAMIAARGGRS